jgi:hypothetical protein
VKHVALLVLTCLSGTAAGGICALWAAGMLGTGPALSDQLRIGIWSSDWSIGSETANPWTRARVARHGLLALRKEEAVYFTANTDSEGRRLRETCTYEVSAGQMPGLWWSVTLYDAGSYLPRNQDGALSFDLTKAQARGMADSWRFTIAPGPFPEQAGISSRGAGAFDLTLRIYKPTEELLASPAKALEAPTIRQLACEGTTE